MVPRMGFIRTIQKRDTIDANTEATVINPEIS